MGDDLETKGACDDQGVEMKLAPHIGRVSLCKGLDGSAILVHRTTLERLPLSGGGWELHFDPAGYGALTKDLGGAPALVEDMLQMKLCSDSAGRLQVMQKSAAGDSVWSLTDRLRHYRTGSCSWSYGTSHSFELLSSRRSRSPGADAGSSSKWPHLLQELLVQADL